MQTLEDPFPQKTFWYFSMQENYPNVSSYSMTTPWYKSGINMSVTLTMDTISQDSTYKLAKHLSVYNFSPHQYQL